MLGQSPNTACSGRRSAEAQQCYAGKDQLMRCRFLLVPVVAVFAACGEAPTGGSSASDQVIGGRSEIAHPVEDRNASDQAVYAAVLRESKARGRFTPSWVKQRTPVEYFVVSPIAETAGPTLDWLPDAARDAAPTPAWIGELLPSPSLELFQDFAQQNLAPGELPQLEAGMQIRLLEWAQLQRFRQTGADRSWSWEYFWHKYPASTGLIFLSHVGYNKERDQALVYCASHQGSEFAAGYLVVLRRGSGWHIESEIMLWVS